MGDTGAAGEGRRESAGGPGKQSPVAKCSVHSCCSAKGSRKHWRKRKPPGRAQNPLIFPWSPFCFRGLEKNVRNGRQPSARSPASWSRARTQARFRHGSRLPPHGMAVPPATHRTLTPDVFSPNASTPWEGYWVTRCLPVQLLAILKQSLYLLRRKSFQPRNNPSLKVTASLLFWGVPSARRELAVGPRCAEHRTRTCHPSHPQWVRAKRQAPFWPHRL